MKRRLGITAILFLSSITVFSQSKLNEEQKKEFKAQFEAYNTNLNLLEDQASKMEEINLAYFEGLADLKNTNDSRLAKYKRLKNLNEERNSKAKKILTTEQYKIYMQHQKEMKKKIRERRSSR